MAALSGTVFTIELLMTIAAVGAVIIGAAEEAATVVFLFLVGELLEGVAAGRARASIKSLTALVPKTALVERDGRTEDVPADKVEVGSVIVVRPGERIAADGQVIDGESAVNEAPVTGESTPVRKRSGDSVFAGTISTDAVCTSRSRRLRRTTLSHVSFGWWRRLRRARRPRSASLTGSLATTRPAF